MTTTKDPGPPAGLCDVARTVDAASVWAAAYAIGFDRYFVDKDSADDETAQLARAWADRAVAAWGRTRT